MAASFTNDANSTVKDKTPLLSIGLMANLR